MYVGISKELKKEILNHIDQMAADQLGRTSSQTDPFPEGISGPEWASRIEAKAWGKQMVLKGELPGEWMRAHRLVDVYFEWNGEEKALHVTYEGDIIDFPPTFDERSAPDIFFQAEDLTPDIEEMIDRHLRLQRDTEERYERTKEEITKLLSRCKSLNEAVALFPDLRYFLSEGVKARLDAKRNGGAEAKPDTRLEGIDTALITSAMVVEQLHPDKED
jgi:hypothetical protein